MDCKELMIGDWVSYKDDPPYIVRGTSICEVVTIDNGIDHRNVMDDAINPIPLTSDILEKNGFERDENNQCIFRLKRFEIEYIGWSDGRWASHHLVIKYVHQLQHLLRLAGVQKEIEL